MEDHIIMAQKRYKPKFESTARKFGKLKEMDMDPTMDDSGSETSGMEDEFGTENLQWDNEEDIRPSEDMFESKRSKKKRYVREQDDETDSSEEKDEDEKEKEDMKEMLKKLSKQVSFLSKKIKEAEDSEDKKDDEEEDDSESEEDEKKEESISNGFAKIFRETKSGPGLL